MKGFIFNVACLRLVAYKLLFGIYAVSVVGPVLSQNLRTFEAHMVLCF